MRLRRWSVLFAWQCLMLLQVVSGVTLDELRVALDLPDVVNGQDRTRMQLLYAKHWGDSYDAQDRIQSSTEKSSIPWKVGSSETKKLASTRAVDFALLDTDFLVNAPEEVMGAASGSYVCTTFEKGKDYDSRCYSTRPEL